MTAGWAATADRVLPRLLRRRAGERPGAPFLRIEDGPAETFSQVLAAAERIAGQLAGLGVGPGRPGAAAGRDLGAVGARLAGGESGRGG